MVTGRGSVTHQLPRTTIAATLAMKREIGHPSTPEDGQHYSFRGHSIPNLKQLDVDLFASSLIHQLASYVSDSKGNGDRYIHPELGRAQGLCQPSMEPDRENNKTGQKPESTPGPGDASFSLKGNC